MTPIVYPSMLHLNGNLMAAVDLETTGVRPGYHEIVQIAILPLDADFHPLAAVKPFYTLMKPQFPKRAEKGAMAKNNLQINDLLLSAPEPDKVADYLVEWFESLRLPIGKSLIPLAHNWAFESSFLKAWLGITMVDQIFHAHCRDSMILASAINDKAAFACEDYPFTRVNLNYLCKKLKIENLNAHDALSDARAESKLYRTLLQML